MNYIYYPGCSLKGIGRAYEESLLSIFEHIGLNVSELSDWNCCGATAYMSIDESKAFALSARNLALAEMQGDGNETINLIAPCSGCYLVLSKAQRYLSEYRPLGDKIIDAMQNTGLNYTGKVRIRHPLDVLVNDVGLEKISSLVKRSLGYLRVACYYGCQIMRPYATFDDQHEPNTMNRLLQILGAETISWPLSTRCCGGSLTGTFDKVGLRLNYILLKDAVRRGANVIATACPLCQFNLESYQTRIGRQYKDDVSMPIAYFTQIIGYALGIAERRLGMRRLSVPPSLSAAGDVVRGGGYGGK